MSEFGKYVLVAIENNVVTGLFLDFKKVFGVLSLEADLSELAKSLQ
jgi:hypothetical protein